jgi:hypothetical protein
MEPEGSLPYSQVPATRPYPNVPFPLLKTSRYFLWKHSPPPRRTHWGSSLPPEFFFIPRGSISFYEYFVTWTFSRGRVVSNSLNPQAGGPPLVDCPRLLIQFIHNYPPYRRPFLHPQPEDAPCRGDRDIHGIKVYIWQNEHHRNLSALQNEHHRNLSALQISEYQG